MYWVLKWLVLGPVVWIVTRPVVNGKLPRRGPLIMASNHLTEIDSLVLGAALSRRLTFVAKSEYFARGGMRGRFYGLVCRATGQIPIERGGDGRGDAGLEAARKILDAGMVWAIYPEGTRSPDGKLHRGRTGVMRVALSRPDVPVVPVAVQGTTEIDKPRQRFWRPAGRVRITVGKPLDLSRWTDRADDPAAWREATDALMREIQALSGQEYVDRYPTDEEIARRDGRTMAASVKTAGLPQQRSASAVSGERPMAPGGTRDR